jgi:gas vesicle protein
MTAYELELIAMAKNRGDSLSRQLADIVKKQDEQITELESLKMRELTDEEIEEVAKPYCDLQNWVVDKHEFARAIIKKASEK